MSGANRLFNIMASAGTDTISEVLYGRVKSVGPIIIVLEGDDDRAELTENFLVLSKLCQEFVITTAVHTHVVPPIDTELDMAPRSPDDPPEIIGTHTHISPQNTTEKAHITLLIWSGLHVGERVILISFNSGQKFFVEKLERWDNEADDTTN